MRPDTQHRFLGDIFGLGGIAENAAGEASHGRQMPAGKQAECLLVAARDPGHERFVTVVHLGSAIGILRNPSILDLASPFNGDWRQNLPLRATRCAGENRVCELVSS
jgi:hypothetical protein